EDLTALDKVDGIEVHPMRTMDAILADYEYTLRLYPYDTDTAVNKYALVSGRQIFRFNTVR
ncbi:hypothetical protein, partial [Jeotgalibaca porci]|uniref:hypothetical protein n=1 Tax=Jeotgalibaca porci TaxID=1868793 RepID=UPI0035A1460D